jgi:alpha-tubulin suppressor-like RCC1 family protein
MIPVACTLIRRLAPVLASALLVAVVGCREDAESPSAPESGAALDVTAAQALSFRQVSASLDQSCGVTTADRAYCWGTPFFGVPGRPVAVPGGLRFRHVETDGQDLTCGVTTDNRAFCWGANLFGELGDGTTTGSETPIAVAGGLRFAQVDAGSGHSCGVTTDNRAFCWGLNNSGQLGIGTNSGPEICNDLPCSTRPVAVVGSRRFRQVSAGSGYTCGVTPFDRAFCWGANPFGNIGDGATAERRIPVAVAGGLQFSEVSAGSGPFPHTCGVTTGERAFCWGFNENGELGDGTTANSLTPVAVASGLRFRQVTAAGSHTCAVNPFDRAFCWGVNRFGQLGDGTTTQRLTPVRVLRGLRWRQLSGGGSHTCGVTTADVAYCWGSNSNGQLGDGTLKNRLRPVPVIGPS